MEWHKVEPINSTRIYEEIVRQIRTLISEGKLKSGDKLPPERELAERFKVSRPSVREAMRALESMGLIEIRLGEGTFVREISVDSLVERTPRHAAGSPPGFADDPGGSARPGRGPVALPPGSV